MKSIAHCYEKELLSTPKLAGKITITFTIEPDGRVSSASAAGLTEAVGACVVGVLKKLRFPGDTGTMIVSYPFKFRPAGS
jgi:hypothetical protein